MEKKTEAAFSVYMTLMLAVMIPLIFTMIEAARINAIKLRLECAVALSLDSVSAEYNRELMEQYELLFIDTAYDMNYGSTDEMVEHLKDCLSYNLSPSKGFLLPGTADLYGLSTESAEVINVSRATDKKGAVFRYMVMSAMLDRYGLSYVEDAKDLVNRSKSEALYSGNIANDLSDAQSRVNAIEAPTPTPAPTLTEDEDAEVYVPPAKDNPASKVNGLKNRGILTTVCKGAVSARTIKPKEYVSGRRLIKGDGMCTDWKERNSLAEQLMFNEYILEKCGNYITPKPGSRLAYEAEYVIGGKSCDTDNLKAVANGILLMQGASNYTVFYSSKDLQKQAESAAALLSFVIMVPESKDAFQALLSAAWIYSESIYDTRIVFAGGKVPLIKKREDWHLSLAAALSCSYGPVPTGGEGCDYKDYLRLLLYAVSLDKRTVRLMDIVEMDVRERTGNEYFKLDNCVGAASLRFIFRSSYGYSFLMERRFRYV
ncbi:MAG: hypothetical protein IKI75_03995 [Lachnospiraceae bacterium]|nr:hypothetical protein [Lachnospiraceae bacterium]